jgi:hypothetical protein
VGGDAFDSRRLKNVASSRTNFAAKFQFELGRI